MQNLSCNPLSVSMHPHTDMCQCYWLAFGWFTFRTLVDGYHGQLWGNRVVCSDLAPTGGVRRKGNHSWPVSLGHEKNAELLISIYLMLITNHWFTVYIVYILLIPHSFNVHMLHKTGPHRVSGLKTPRYLPDLQVVAADHISNFYNMIEAWV